jgi:hypothetical protein
MEHKSRARALLQDNGPVSETSEMGQTRPSNRNRAWSVHPLKADLR